MRMFRWQSRTRPAPVNSDNAPTILPFRNIPFAYEVTALGKTEPTNPSASWSRGALVRTANPVLEGHLAMPPPVPMYDPTTEGPPEYWRP